MPFSELTTSSLLAVATEVLVGGGYMRSDRPLAQGWPTTARLFEDEYGVVAVVVHDTWGSLATTWQDSQARFVELLGEKVGQGDAKAWEGYLVLLTPGSPATADERLAARRIRYNTSRVRKLVATGYEITATSDVERALISLLPFPRIQSGPDPVSILESLPPLLQQDGIPTDRTERLIRAFERQTPLLAAMDPAGEMK